MHTIELSQDWWMAAARDVQGVSPPEPGCDTWGWLPVTVPTTVQAALVEAGVVTDPWLDHNTRRFEPFEADTWWFRREIALTEEQAGADAFVLVLEGVGLLCTVWLNGSPVAFTHNAHHAHRIDVTQHIRRDGPTALALECRLDLDAARRRVRKDVSKDADEYRVYLRTCQMSFGWDFAPRLPLAGPWRPVRLECHDSVSLDDLYVRTDGVDDRSVQLHIEATVRAMTTEGRFDLSRSDEVLSIRMLPANIVVHLAIHEDRDGPPIWAASGAASAGSPLILALSLENMRLWWPNGAGEPFLYTLKAEVEVDGVVTDTRTQRFGVRTVELKQERRFTFCINGRDIFARGANWVPPDSLTLDTTAEKYRHLLGLAHDAHFNMLRVWGGGTYENETFYDLCDELGIMVWQDFMYACAMYPDDEPEFMESAAHEAAEVVTRLRRHPSVVLLCGNNECQEAWELGDWSDRAPRHMGERLYDHVLPDTVGALSPGTPYWPGSPYGGPTTRSRDIGDFHDWYSFPEWRKYDANAPRFSSEYGFRSVPHRATVDAMISPQYQWDPHGPQNVVWKSHHGWCDWMRDMLPEFGAPKTLDEWIMLTQEAQATMMRYAIAVYRRRMFETAGSLIWQYNEPWPAVTFSLVDYFGRAKAAYHWVRHACAPVIGLFYNGGGPLEFWGVSDLPEPADCIVRLRRYRHDGGLLGEASARGCLSPSTATQILAELPADIQIASPEDELIHAELRCGDRISECVHHASLRKDWHLAPTQLEAAARRLDTDRIAVTLAAPVYVHWASVSVSDPTAHYSDNFIDLLPGEPGTIGVRGHLTGEILISAANAQVGRLAIP